MTPIRVGLFLSLLLTGAAACGGGNVQDTDITSGAGSAGAAGFSGSSGGAEGTDARKRGSILFGVWGFDLSSGSAPSNAAQAGFIVYASPPKAPPDDHCTTTTAGSCQLSVCFTPVNEFKGQDGAAGGPNVPPPGPKPDTLTITGGAVTPLSLESYTITQPYAPSVVAASGYVAAPSVLQGEALVKGGETISVTATGGDVPPFTLHGTVPSSPHLSGWPPLTPLGSAGAGVTPSELDTSKDLVLTSQQGTGGTMNLLLRVGVQSDTGYTSGAIFCSVDASTPLITLPTAALQTLKNIDPSAIGQIDLSAGQSLQVEDWEMSLVLANGIRDGSGHELPSAFLLTLK